VDGLLGFFARRTRDPDLAADLTAAVKKLADAQRRGYAERRARRRLGMERIELTDADVARIEALGEEPAASVLVERLAPEQRDAVRARVVDGRSYADIASYQHVTEAVVRQRVSRGLASVRRRMGIRQ